MSSHIFWKFRNAKNEHFSRIVFDGPNISVLHLKRAIVQQALRDVKEDFDLQLVNAQNGEEYTDDQRTIPRNTSVIVKRVPASSTRKYTISLPLPDNMILHTTHTNIKEPDIVQQINEAVGPPVFDDKVKRQAEERMQQMDTEIGKIFGYMNTQEINMAKNLEKPTRRNAGHPSNTNNSNFNRPIRRNNNRYDGKPTPPGYICHRCKLPGHWIQHCPTNGDPAYDRPKPRFGHRGSMEAPRDEERDTDMQTIVLGAESITLPKSMAENLSQDQIRLLLEAQKHGYADTAINAAFVQSHLKSQSSSVPTTRPSKYSCELCNNVFKNATLTQCCKTTYCQDCILNYLRKHFFKCPKCDHPCDPESLYPNDVLQEKVDEYMQNISQQLSTFNALKNVTSSNNTTNSTNKSNKNMNTIAYDNPASSSSSPPVSSIPPPSSSSSRSVPAQIQVKVQLPPTSVVSNIDGHNTIPSNANTTANSNMVTTASSITTTPATAPTTTTTATPNNPMPNPLPIPIHKQATPAGQLQLKQYEQAPVVNITVVKKEKTKEVNKSSSDVDHSNSSSQPHPWNSKPLLSDAISQSDHSNDVCMHCHEKGHLWKNCEKRRKDMESKNNSSNINSTNVIKMEEDSTIFDNSHNDNSSVVSMPNPKPKVQTLIPPDDLNLPMIDNSIEYHDKIMANKTSHLNDSNTGGNITNTNINNSPTPISNSTSVITRPRLITTGAPNINPFLVRSQNPFVNNNLLGYGVKPTLIHTPANVSSTPFGHIPPTSLSTAVPVSAVSVPPHLAHPSHHPPLGYTYLHTTTANPNAIDDRNRSTSNRNINDVIMADHHPHSHHLIGPAQDILTNPLLNSAQHSHTNYSSNNPLSLYDPHNVLMELRSIAPNNPDFINSANDHSNNNNNNNVNYNNTNNNNTDNNNNNSNNNANGSSSGGGNNKNSNSRNPGIPTIAGMDLEVLLECLNQRNKQTKTKKKLKARKVHRDKDYPLSSHNSRSSLRRLDKSKKRERERSLSASRSRSRSRSRDRDRDRNKDKERGEKEKRKPKKKDIRDREIDRERNRDRERERERDKDKKEKKKFKV